MVPKQFPDELRLRAVALLVELKNASEAAAQVMREFPGYEVASQTVSRWGKGLRVKLVSGRRKGSRPTRFSPYKEAIIACHAEGLTQAQTCVRLGLSRALVSKHWPRTSLA